jgi:hypothetical protein
MHLRRWLALVGAASAAAFAACKEPPFAPTWDADMYMPLSTQPIHLNTFFTLGVIPPAISGTVSFPAQQQDISGVLGDVLKNVVTDAARCSLAANPALSCDLLTLTVAKTKPFAATDTLFVANAQANLNAGVAGTVVFPISLATTDATKTDSLYLTQQSVAMLQNAGKTGTSLWVQLRGQVSNPSTTTAITITSADSLGITLAATLRIAVVHK